ncbi:hypothetical protein BHM03_00036326 [Ensete ventricosum]|nr:hypothetical protein BHM03_00036326 [Ensete ventricosum]
MVGVSGSESRAPGSVDPAATPPPLVTAERSEAVCKRTGKRVSVDRPKLTVGDRLREKRGGRRRRGEEERRRRGEEEDKYLLSPRRLRPRTVLARERFFSRARRRNVSQHEEKD